ncbi:hypothetical protein BRD07_00775 [Halobacteriales archaeon QS_9_68_42]|nr:MAG: hypothetical protein BRD07_00775 [Halobacteriales archaeon QS_9_68_42]
MAWRELALLWAARECGALEALAARAGTPEAVAEAADIDPAGAEAAVEAAGAAAPVGSVPRRLLRGDGRRGTARRGGGGRRRGAGTGGRGGPVVAGVRVRGSGARRAAFGRRRARD